MLKPQNLYMHNVIEWYRNAIQRMDAYLCPQQHVRVDRGVERRGVEWRVDLRERGRQEEQDLWQKR